MGAHQRGPLGQMFDTPNQHASRDIGEVTQAIEHDATDDLVRKRRPPEAVAHVRIASFLPAPAPKPGFSRDRKKQLDHCPRTLNKSCFLGAIAPHSFHISIGFPVPMRPRIR